ncbi:arylesterase [Fulvivirga sedimenti]|uniref:Arylesterase n=1 Tax=Fulvivirga sedimenti TaxID=2879465 RepID=A0A9X1HM62_9BACT|nr:arylesterase [Fulvivirga sedimenti]MCA6073555.1 arylesterase [Fulvivirga sedimenti]
MIYLKQLFLVLWLALPFQQEDPVRILFFGDSLTAGYGLSEEQAFPALVEKQLQQRGGNYEVINAGLSGETSAGGNSRIDWILRQKIDILVLELGANDGLRGLPLEQTRQNLQSIIDKTRAKNPDVQIVIAGMQVPPNLGEDYASGFRKIFPELAKNNNAVLIPFLLEGVAGDKSLNLPDGIHPNPKGHQIVASNVLKALDETL